MDPLSTSIAVLLSDPKSAALSEQFLNERCFLNKRHARHTRWYETAWKALQRAQHTQSPELTKSALQQFVVSLRERGVKPVSCNTYIKALNAFCLWAHTEGQLEARVELQPLKVEKRILPMAACTLTIYSFSHRTFCFVPPGSAPGWKPPSI